MIFFFRTCLLLALLGFSGYRSRAQVVTIDSIKLARVGGLYLPAARRAIVFSVEQEGRTTRFRQYAYNTTLGHEQRQEVRLPGSYQLVNAASSRHHLLYQLHRRGTDTIVTLVVDTLGRVVKRAPNWFRGQWRELRGTLAPQANGFLLGEPNSRRAAMTVRYFDPQLQLRWEHRFTSAKGKVEVETAILDSTHAWLLVTSNAQSRRATTKAYCMDLANGHVLCRLPLDYQGQRRVPGVVAMGPGHSLLLAGYSYTNNRPSRVRTGHLFYTRLSPDSTRSHDQLVGISSNTRLLSTKGRNVLWQALQPEVDGSVRLVGETYTSTSLGANIAINVATAIVTLGILRISTTTLRPRDVISLRLTPTGQLDEVRLLPLPDGGSYTLGGYVPARSMAQLVAPTGIFRMRGFAPDSNRVVLRTPKRILTMEVHTGQATTIRPTPSNSHLDVWHVEPQRILLYQEQRSPQRIQLERVAY